MTEAMSLPKSPSRLGRLISASEVIPKYSSKVQGAGTRDYLCNIFFEGQGGGGSGGGGVLKGIGSCLTNLTVFPTQNILKKSRRNNLLPYM